MPSLAAPRMLMLPSDFFSWIYSFAEMACFVLPVTLSVPDLSISICPLQYSAAFCLPPEQSARVFTVPFFSSIAMRLPHSMSMCWLCSSR